MTIKRILLVGFGLLLLIAILLQFIPSNTRRYRADSVVLAMPFTNSLLARSFETHVVQTIPGVRRLHVSQSSTRVPTPGLPPATNGIIRIEAFGPTPEAAQQAAIEAATKLSRTVLPNYGASGEILDVPTSARRYSYFQPAIERLFKR